MLRVRIFVKILLPVSVFTIAFVTPAFAYLDPGTGSMIVQAIVGGIAVAGATVGVYWTKVKSLTSRLFGTQPPRS
jgi:hypothetical protein